MYFAYFRNFFLFSFLINAAIMLLWFVAFVFAKDFIYKIHNKMFKISKENFEILHYGGIGLYKILNSVFFFVPFIVLYFASR